MTDYEFIPFDKNPLLELIKKNLGLLTPPERAETEAALSNSAVSPPFPDFETAGWTW